MAGKPGSADRIPRLTPQEAAFEMARVNAESQRAEIVRLNARIDELKGELAAREDDIEKLTRDRDTLARRVMSLKLGK